MPTSELVRRSPHDADAAQAARISSSRLVPEHIANDAASVEYMMAIGRALGIEPVSAFQHIYVFPASNGRLKAGMSAHLMQALAIAAGHSVHVEGNALKATAVLIRKTSMEDLHRFNSMREAERQQKQDLLDQTQRLFTLQRDQIRDQIQDLKDLAEMGGEEVSGELTKEIKGLQQQLLGLRKQYDFDKLREQVAETSFDLTRMVRFKSEWTRQRAEQAGLSGKDVWQNFGPEMLKARAKASVIRDGAIDVILGIKEIMSDLGLEFSDEVDDEIAVSSVLYTPEEVGAEVDGDGAPIKGRVVDVTVSGADKEQNRRIAAARKLVNKKTTDELKVVVDEMVRIGKDQEETAARLSAISTALSEAGKGNEEVQQGDGSCTFSVYVENKIHAINNSEN